MITDRTYDLLAWVQFQVVGAHEGQLGPVFGSLMPAVAEASCLEERAGPIGGADGP